MNEKKIHAEVVPRCSSRRNEGRQKQAMQLALHIGAHFTEEERLMKCLLRNKGDFARQSIAVPGPGKYRDLLRETLSAMQNIAPNAEAREVLLDAFLDDEDAARVILSNAHFAGPPRYAVREERFYPATPQRLRSLAELFERDEIELFLAIRNPATFLTALHTHLKEKSPEAPLPDADPTRLQWSGLVQKIRNVAPSIRVTVWCNEDLPLIWGQVIRAIAGLQPSDPIIGAFDLLEDIMHPDALKPFNDYIAGHPGLSAAQQRQVIVAFLEKFALEDAVEEELDMPGWTDELVDRATALYDQDVAEIASLPGVTLIAP